MICLIYSGAGKTTLLDVLAGRKIGIQPTSCTLTYVVAVIPSAALLNISFGLGVHEFGIV